jgi:hypothetical protein
MTRKLWRKYEHSIGGKNHCGPGYSSDRPTGIDKTQRSRGVSEIRAVFGGLFIGLGLAPFFLGGAAYTMLGIGYLAIAMARTFSIVFDKSFAQSNWISLGIEIVLGMILVF